MRINLLVRYLVAAVLLLAASIKLFASSTIDSSGPLSSYFRAEFQSIVAPVELLLALWLISGWGQRTSLNVSAGLFALFTIVNAISGWQGATSCGCFGKVQVDPWIMSIVDLLIFALIVLALRKTPTSDSDQTAREIVLGMAGIAAAITLFAYDYFGSMSAFVGYLTNQPMVLEVATIEVESGNATDEHEFLVEVANLTSNRVQITTASSQCASIDFSELPCWLEANQRYSMTAKIRLPSEEGRFCRKFRLHTTVGELSGTVCGNVLRP